MPEREDIRVDLGELIRNYAERSGDRVYIDPRVRGYAPILGRSPDQVSFDELRLLLRQNKMAIIESGGYLLVVPKNDVKTMPLRLVKEGETYSDLEEVSIIIKLTKSCPSDLVPVLRPILPPTDHFAPISDARAILLTSTYAQAMRIKELASEIDDLMPKKMDCKSKMGCKS